MTLQPQKNQEPVGAARDAASPFGEAGDPAAGGQALALLALSHTLAEHRLYQAMHVETIASGKRIASFSVQRLTKLTGLNSYTTIRRARAGLAEKLSIERQRAASEGDVERLGAVYFVFTPEEIFERRRAAGLAPYPAQSQPVETSRPFGLAVERVVEHYDLSRREAQVALCCAEGLTNAEIGEKLFICKQTVKFHMRNIFAKCRVRRRTELISRLLMQGDRA